MKICVHAGHNPDGKIACGAVGIIKESTAARQIVATLYPMLKEICPETYDITVNDGSSQQNVLNRLNAQANQILPDLNLSIHLNAGGGHGVEAYVYEENHKAKDIAGEILARLETLGYENRGVKSGNSLSIIKNTKSTTVLVECGFVDSDVDCALFDANKIAAKIRDAISTIIPGGVVIPNTDYIEDSNTFYRVQVGAFRDKTNAEKLQAELKAKGYDVFITQV